VQGGGADQTPVEPRPQGASTGWLRATQRRAVNVSLAPRRFFDLVRWFAVERLERAEGPLLGRNIACPAQLPLIPATSTYLYPLNQRLNLLSLQLAALDILTSPVCLPPGSAGFDRDRLDQRQSRQPSFEQARP
jgi:hypothetical protein